MLNETKFVISKMDDLLNFACGCGYGCSAPLEASYLPLRASCPPRKDDVSSSLK